MAARLDGLDRGTFGASVIIQSDDGTTAGSVPVVRSVRVDENSMCIGQKADAKHGVHDVTSNSIVAAAVARTTKMVAPPFDLLADRRTAGSMTREHLCNSLGKDLKEGVSNPYLMSCADII